jgi:hypothetical protein
VNGRYKVEVEEGDRFCFSCSGIITKSRQGWQNVAPRLSPGMMEMARLHPEAIFDGKTPIVAEGVPDTEC